MKKFIEMLVIGGWFFYAGYRSGYGSGKNSLMKEANSKICQAMAKGKICP